MSFAIARIGAHAVDIRTLSAGTTIDILERDDIRIVFLVIDPELRLIELVGMHRVGRGDRRLTINPSEISYLRPGTRLIPCAFPGRTPKVTYSDGPLTVGTRAGFEILDNTECVYAMAPIKRIVVRE